MRFLAVEGDRLLKNTLCCNLSAAGAMTKASAAAFCKAQDCDLAVLDVNLSNGNGFDFCVEIEERRSDTAVIKTSCLKTGKG